MTSQTNLKYKIRDMVTGLYQDEGCEKSSLYPAATWSKKGNIWCKMSDLKLHLNLLQKNYITISPLWQIIEIESVGSENNCYPATALI